MLQLNQVAKNIRTDWDNCELFKLLEYQTSDDDWLTAQLKLTGKGVEFRFDTDNKPTSFSGDVIKTGNGIYLIKHDCYSLDNLDSLIQAIDQEMTEGYLLPNNLYYCEELTNDN